MKKLRSSLAAIALAITLIGSAFVGIGAGSLANVASSQHTSDAWLAGKTTQSVAFRPLWPCPWAAIDC
jgi:hypothetical protein